MKNTFALVICLLATNSFVSAQTTAAPYPELANPPGWPLVGYGLAFLLVGGAVFVSMYVGKRSNIK
ncbi:MAG: hypothetical protein EXS12_01425 [Phycisphaerales bacterium]|nr:hypothetical protein [Phycisphaerales bacterium]